MEEWGNAAGSLLEEIRRLRDEPRKDKLELREAVRERDELKEKVVNALAQIEEARARATAAEERADRHIHQADQDRVNAVENHLANLRPVLRSHLIDVDDPLPDEEALPETEQLLWLRLREIKRTLREQGVLLD